MAQIPRYSFNRKTWSPEEDSILTEYIRTHGEGHWTSLPLKAGLKRRGKSCRLRWFNYLHPNIKRGNFSGDEEELIIRLHRLLGNRWSLIAKRLPGRTDNDVKNYWNTHLCKQYRGKNKATNTPFKKTSSKNCYWNSTVTDKMEETNVIANGECIKKCEPCENKTVTETAGCFMDKHSVFCEKQDEENSYHDTVQHILKSHDKRVSICSQNEEESYHDTVDQKLLSHEPLSICSQYEEASYHNTVKQNLQSHEPASAFSQHDLLQMEINSDMNNLLYPYTYSISPLFPSEDFCDFWGNF